MPGDDLHLLLAARRGDQRAARVLWDRHAPRLTAYLRLIVRSEHAVADSVQSVFCTLLALPEPRLRQVADFAAFLTRLARNAAINTLRSEHRRRLHSTAAGRTSERQLSGKAVATHAPGDDLSRAVNMLPRRLREVVMLRHGSGLTYDQIADALGSHKTTIASRHEAALAALRSILARDDSARAGSSPPLEVLHVR